MHAQIAVVGATGLVGRELLAALKEAGHPAEKLTLLASERSEGEELDYGEETLAVEKAEASSFRGVALALLALPAEVASELAPAAQATGSWVVDLSSAFRGKVPMLLPGVNDSAIETPFPGRIVSVPGAASSALFSALEPLRKTFGLEQVELTALFPASHRGKRGVEELSRQTAALLSGRELEAKVFPHRLAFNLVPQVGSFSHGWSQEELCWREDAERLWGQEAGTKGPWGTALQVPWFFGLVLVVSAKLKRRAAAEEVRAAFRDCSRLKLLDQPEEGIYPMPMLVTADPAVHVGRVRAAPGAPEWTTFLVAVDNAGRGGALNAVELGLRLLSRK